MNRNTNYKIRYRHSAYGIRSFHPERSTIPIVIPTEAQYPLSSRPKSAVGGRSGGIWPTKAKSFTPLCLLFALIFVAAGCEKKPTKSLHQAARDGDIELLQLYISKGADVNAATQAGWSPLHLAAVKGRKDVIELLRKYGAKE